MKLKQIFLLSFTFLACNTGVVFAHSGRTDAQGGHHDYKNVSGLGSYHYHHGCSAHLHPEGICPYAIEVPTSNEIKRESTPVQEKQVTEIPPVTVIKINFNGEEKISDISPQMMENKVMIPAQSIFDCLNIQVNWDIATNKITCSKNETVIILTIEETNYLVNGDVLSNGCCTSNSRWLFIFTGKRNWRKVWI